MIARASPNIAFLKYWGKKPITNDLDRNLALNPSLSMTLSQAHTETSVRRALQTKVEINHQLASEKDFFKVQGHIERVCDHLNYSAKTFEVKSFNNFPQGTGIASSASAFAALTWAVIGEILGAERAREYFSENLFELSQLARRGSGSASRSVAGPFMKWDGEGAYHIPLSWKLFDTIVIFSREHKKVTSSEGHELALSSPHFEARQKKIPQRLRLMEDALLQRDLHTLGPLLEVESDEMHNIAATSERPVIYAGQGTRTLLTSIKNLPNREFYYTLDAGPNVHLISTRPIRDEVSKLLAKTGLSAEIWEDHCGTGPCII